MEWLHQMLKPLKLTAACGVICVYSLPASASSANCFVAAESYRQLSTI